MGVEKGASLSVMQKNCVCVLLKTVLFSCFQPQHSNCMEKGVSCTRTEKSTKIVGCSSRCKMHFFGLAVVLHALTIQKHCFVLNGRLCGVRVLLLRFSGSNGFMFLLLWVFGTVANVLRA